MLLHHGVVWNERTASGTLRVTWSRDYVKWARSIRLPEDAENQALKFYLTGVPVPLVTLGLRDGVVYAFAVNNGWGPMDEAVTLSCGFQGSSEDVAPEDVSVSLDVDRARVDGASVAQAVRMELDVDDDKDRVYFTGEDASPYVEDVYRVEAIVAPTRSCELVRRGSLLFVHVASVCGCLHVSFRAKRMPASGVDALGVRDPTAEGR